MRPKQRPDYIRLAYSRPEAEPIILQFDPLDNAGASTGDKMMAALKGDGRKGHAAGVFFAMLLIFLLAIFA